MCFDLKSYECSDRCLSVRIQGQTAPPTACSVTYQDHGPGTQLDPSELYLTYTYSPNVTSLADCTQLCDDDSQCKAFGFYQDVNGVLCGLSEADYVLSPGTCTPCHVYVKNCSAGMSSSSSSSSSSLSEGYCTSLVDVVMIRNMYILF